MTFDPITTFASLLALVAAGAAFLAVQSLRSRLETLRAIGEQSLAAQRTEAETLRTTIAATERALAAATATAGGQLRLEVTSAINDMRAASEQRLADIQTALNEQLHAMADRQSLSATHLRQELTTAITAMRTSNEAKLGEIQTTVNEQLHAAVEKQMTASFARVTEQFAAVQKAMGEMQAVGAQIGDIKRLFGNVKTRGGWGETQVRAMLDDILPEGTYETNWRPRPDSADSVEFAVIMPGRGADRPRLPIDAKFPVEDYERLLAAQDAGDPEAERLARRGLEQRVRLEARKLAEKYIVPPVTVEFGVIYLPTDGLYAEVARIPGLIDEIGRGQRVLVMGPSLFPALLRTIHLGHVTLALESKADEVRMLLSATRTEMRKVDETLDRLHKQASTLTTSLDKARTRTRVVDRKLKGVETMDPEAATRLLGADEAEDIEEDPQ